jgi:hypothetical protein
MLNTKQYMTENGVPQWIIDAIFRRDQRRGKLEMIDCESSLGLVFVTKVIKCFTRIYVTTI